MRQLDLLTPPSTLDQAFWEFHRKNPGVYTKLVEMATDAKHLGKRRIGMKMLFEVIRWEHLVHTRGDAFALNNNYTSRYVRIIEENHPELAGLFETRRIRS
jgi:hypothetical protein